MTKDLLWRGMLAGIVAALIATLFARAFAEPQVDRAIAYEASHEIAAGHHTDEEPDLVSRETQKGLGLLTAMSLYGAAVGGVFAMVFAYGYGRLTRMGPRSFAALLATLAFIILVIVPALKYPPTPPAVGKHETVGFRTAAYFGLLAISLVGAVVATKVRALLLSKRGSFDATLVGGLFYILLMAMVFLAMPLINEVPHDFPATVLWSFRVSAIGTQLVLWSAIGLLFGSLAERLLYQQKP